MGRLNCGIHRCPNCDYCSPNISQSKLVNKQLLISKDYIDQLNSIHFPELANLYLCSSLIQKEIDDYNSAMGSIIYATTVCENYFNQDAADNCRRKIIELIEFLEQKPDFYNLKLHDKERFLFLKIYYLRRLGEFERAKDLFEQNINKVKTKDYRIILEFLYGAILKRDKGGNIDNA